MRVLRTAMLGLVATALAVGVAAGGERAGTGCGAGPCGVGDYDGDFIKDWADNCPLNGNRTQKDVDMDTPAPVVDAGEPPDPVGQNTGPIRLIPWTPAQTGQTLPTDRPETQGGDACDLDDDNDGVYDRKKAGKKGPDNCRHAPNEDQADSDQDGLGDACDKDFNPPGNVAVVDAEVKAPKRLRPLRYDQVGYGLIVRVSCTAACRLGGELVARRTVVGRGTAALEGAGRTYLVVKIPSRSLRNLRRKVRRLRGVIRLSKLGEQPVPVGSIRVVLRR